MKKYPKVIQADNRGQIVIPKDIRRELGIEEGTGFWVYSVTDEGILLKKIDAPDLDSQENGDILSEIDEKAEKLGVEKENMDKSKRRYKRTTKGNLEVL
jgi:AbrB family looped-hinge helix DNA binding protein